MSHYDVSEPKLASMPFFSILTYALSRVCVWINMQSLGQMLLVGGVLDMSILPMQCCRDSPLQYVLQ